MVWIMDPADPLLPGYMHVIYMDGYLYPFLRGGKHLRVKFISGHSAGLTLSLGRLMW